MRVPWKLGYILLQYHLNWPLVQVAYETHVMKSLFLLQMQPTWNRFHWVTWSSHFYFISLF